MLDAVRSRGLQSEYFVGTCRAVRSCGGRVHVFAVFVKSYLQGEYLSVLSNRFAIIATYRMDCYWLEAVDYVIALKIMSELRREVHLSRVKSYNYSLILMTRGTEL